MLYLANTRTNLTRENKSSLIFWLFSELLDSLVANQQWTGWQILFFTVVKEFN